MCAILSRGLKEKHEIHHNNPASGDRVTRPVWRLELWGKACAIVLALTEFTKLITSQTVVRDQAATASGYCHQSRRK